MLILLFLVGCGGALPLHVEIFDMHYSGNIIDVDIYEIAEESGELESTDVRYLESNQSTMVDDGDFRTAD